MPKPFSAKLQPELYLTFNAKKLGESLFELEEHPLSHIEGDFKCRWFGSPYECNIILWYDKNNILFRQQVIFWGQTVEWSIVQGCMTGILMEEEMTDFHQGQVKMAIRFDEQKNKIGIHQAIEVIEAAKTLAATDKTSLIHNFRESPKITDLSDQEILRLLKV